MNLIIESEQRVGSRWIHYLLAHLYGMNPSPEIDGSRLRKNPDEVRETVQGFFDEGRIVKFHHVEIDNLIKEIPGDYKVITIVRNPRDRGVSLAFHHKYDKAGYKQKDMSEERALEYTILEYPSYVEGNERMLRNMKPGFSTHSKLIPSPIWPQRWIAYEWLKENPKRELDVIIRWIKARMATTLDEAIDGFDFKNKSGRNPGEEDRKDTWRRKGIIGDWKNHFDDKMLMATNDIYMEYWKKLRDEGD